MSTQITEETSTDTSLLEELDFLTKPECDNEECSNDATHTIRCNCGRGLEYSCVPCLHLIYSFPNAGIQFDPNKSCGHLTSLFLCEVTPL